MKFSLLALILAAVVTVGCQKKESNDSVISDSELTPFIGTWVACVNFANGSHGTDFQNGSSKLISIKINSNGTFVHNRWYFDGATNCQGGENAISYTQNGTIDVKGASGISGATDVDLHSTSSVVTVRTLTHANFHNDWNTNYPSALLQDTTLGVIGMAIDETAARAGFASLVFDDLYGPTYTSYNSFSVSGGSMTIADPYDWDMGVGTYPGSIALVLTKQ